MRRWLISLFFYIPATASAIAPDDARHLLARTGFEASPEAVVRLAPLSYDAAVQTLLDGLRSRPCLSGTVQGERAAATATIEGSRSKRL